MNIIEQLEWTPLTKGAYARKQPIKKVVLHWTGGKTSESCVSTLKQRGLSIHFTVDADGTIRCHANPATTATQHVGKVGNFSVNAESIGVEIAHKGFAPPFDGPEWHRESYEGVVHGHPVKLLRFTDVQIASVKMLCEYLSTKHRVPRQVPRDASGNVISDVLPLDVMRSFEGFTGHYHYEAMKTDPGVELLAGLFT